MDIAFRAAGALLETADEWTLELPAGTAVGDILVAIFNVQAGETTGTGWTIAASGAGLGASYLTALWRRSDGADPVFFESPGSSGTGVILGFTGGLASGDVISVVGTVGKVLASATITCDEITPPSNNNAILFIGTSQEDSGLLTCSGYSGTGPTFTEVFDGGSGFLGTHVALGVQATAAATGTRTATLSGVADENQGVLIALKPAASSAPSGRSFPRPSPIRL